MGFSGSPCRLSFDYEQWAKTGIVSRGERLRERQFSEDGEKLVDVNLSQLSPQKKRLVWEWIKNNDKPLADLLGKDPLFRQLVEQSNGEINVQIPYKALDQINRDLRSGP